MSALLSVTEVATHLGLATPVTSAEDTLLSALITQVEAAFLAACGRPDKPFQAAQTGRQEHLQGTGTVKLWLDYPISDLTSVTLGTDLTDLDETLDVDDVDVLVWVAGKHWLLRSDGGRFGEEWQPYYTHVTYDAGADLPADAKGAVQSAVVQVFQRRGSEGLLSEQIGPYNAQFAELMSGNGSITSGDPLWRAAVAAHLEVPV
jgi:hypothetical protein